MLKLLIADTSDVFVQAVSKQLRNKFLIERCTDGAQVLKKAQKIRPDILLLDMHLPIINGLDVLRTLRSSGLTMEIVVTGFLDNDWLCAELNSLQVSQLFRKPCSTGAVVSHLRDLESFILDTDKPSENPECVAHHMLLNLGFRMGLGRYQCVFEALMLKYEGEDGGITKCLYPKVAKVCGGNTPQVEKAIRDAVKDAFAQGNEAVWRMYFPLDKDGRCNCPSNEVFLARLSFAMQVYFGKIRKMNAL